MPTGCVRSRSAVEGWSVAMRSASALPSSLRVLPDGSGPVATSSPSLAEYLASWLREVVVEPDYAPLTRATYETLTRLYILPGLGSKRLDKLTLRDVRGWLNKLRDTCQCCAQGKDARRPERQRRCCAKIPATCCRRVSSERTVRDAWTIVC